MPCSTGTVHEPQYHLLKQRCHKQGPDDYHH